MTPLRRELFDSIQARRRPEDVAALAIELLDGPLASLAGDGLTRPERAMLAKAARHAARGLGATSMMDDFARPIGMQNQAAAWFCRTCSRRCPRPQPSRATA